MSKSSKLRIQSSRTAQLVLVGAWAGATAIGCSSDHALGDLSALDLASDAETGGLPATGTSRSDFSVSPQLAYPDVTIRVEADSGPHLAGGVGDLDGDGFDDFATIGFDNATATQLVHVRYGGPRPRDGDGAYTFAESGGRLVADLFQRFPMIYAIVPAGDVDADGHADFLVGVGTCRPTLAGQGAYLFYGGPDRLEGVQRLEDAGVHLKSPRESEPIDERGASCGGGGSPYFGGLGDFDGDGFDDFILSDGQEWEWPNPPVDSVAYLFYGREQRIATGTSWLDADAQLRARQNLGVIPTRDVNGDGFGDLILGGDTGVDDNPSDFFWLPGRAERLDPAVDLAATAMPLAAASAAGDLDGDGIDDVFLYDDNLSAHLFYGAPGLFEGGVDFSQASATFDTGAEERSPEAFAYAGQGARVLLAGDRDGDGDGELLALVPMDITSDVALDVAILSSSHERMSGPVPLREPGKSFPGSFSRFYETVLPAGDLDGDGASDLLTVSQGYRLGEHAEPGYQPEGNYFPEGSAQLHIHYGTLGGTSITPLR